MGAVALLASYLLGRRGNLQTVPEGVSRAELWTRIPTISFYRARLLDAKVGTVIITIPALTNQAAATQLNVAFEGVEGIYGGEAALGQLTIQFDPDQVTAETLVGRINERTTLTARLESAELPATEAGSAFSVQTLVRYAIWGVVVITLLWGGWGFARGRLRLNSAGPGRWSSV